MYSIQIDNITSQITPKLPYVFNKYLYDTLISELEGRKFLLRHNKWDGIYRLYNYKKQSFGTGLLNKVKLAFDLYKIPYQIIDNRQKPKLKEPYKFTFQYPLRNYQEEALKRMHLYTRGIIKAGTGSGKTIIASKFIADHNVPTLILVPNIRLLTQFRNDLMSVINTNVGIIGDATFDPKRITVATVQSLINAYNNDENDKLSEKYELIRQIVENVNTIIYDECHHNKAKTLQVLSKYARNAYYRFGFSATPFYSSEAIPLVEQLLGRIIIDIPANDLIKQGYLAKPTIKLLNFKHETLNRDGLNYTTVVNRDIISNEKRNRFITEAAIPYIKQNKKVLIAISRIDHGKKLLNLFKQYDINDVEYINGDDDSEVTLKIIKELNKGNVNCVIASRIFSEGIDIPNLDVLINCKAAESFVETIQLAGRALRKTNTKDEVIIIDIQDNNCKFLEKHAIKRKNYYIQEFKDYIEQQLELSL